MSSIPLIMTLLLMGLTLVNSNSPDVNVASGLNEEVEPFDGPTPTLKPLEPVPGTNLFYNVPYKWLDVTKPGCFVTWFYEIFKDTLHTMQVKNREVTLACNNADHRWYNHTDSDWIIEHPKKGQTHGEIVLRNIGAGETLERLDSSGKSWLAVEGYNARLAKLLFITFDEHTWNIMSDPKDRNRVQLEIDGKTVSQHPLPSLHRAFLWMKEGYEDGYPYSFSPSIALELKIKHLEFLQPPEEELSRHTSTKALIDEFIIYNNSPVTASRKVEVSESLTDEFSYGFSQSIKNALKISGSVGIPYVAEGEVAATFEVELGANQNWKTSTDKTIKMSYNVNVPAYSEIRISAWYDLIRDLNMDFMATVEVSGKTRRVNQFDEIVHDVPATGDLIQSQLENTGFEGDILETRSDCVIVQVKGSMVATAGVRGRLNINGEIVQQMEPV